MSEDTAMALLQAIETLCDKIGYLSYLLEEGQR
jgi:hypothetical protein